ncbi:MULTISPECIES: hypothetical protein [Paenibacillus]|uniref:hypothetical protein n=1 Tax=Paenibacillus TaxID=44249 RepID=UPI000B89750E|nr:hypothetical protein [Paenibacillus amylolyticus]
MKKIRSSTKITKVEYEVYSYLSEQKAEEHYNEMITDGWFDEAWNNDFDNEYEAKDIEYTTIRYRKETIL